MKILQLSDCHLCADPDRAALGRRPEATLAALVARLAALQVDRVVFTGDLVDDPEPRLVRRLQRLAAPLAAPCHFLPGNHDHPASLAAVLGTTLVEDCTHLEVAPGRHCLFLNSRRPGAVGGALSQTAWAALEEVLQALGAKARLLVFLHHPPLPVGSAWLDAIGLEDGERLLAQLAAARAQVDGVFFGHVHQAFAGRRHGIPCYGCPSTWVQFAPRRARFAYDARPPGARLIHWRDAGVETRCLWLEAS